MKNIEWAVVVPAKGELARTARELIDLAGDPTLVRTDGNGNEFRVPASIAQVWHEVRAAEHAPPPDHFADTGKVITDEPPAPKPVQRRGRAPRVPVEE